MKVNMRLKILLALWISISTINTNVILAVKPVNLTVKAPALAPENNPEAETQLLIEACDKSYEQFNQVEALLERLVLVSNRNMLKLEPAKQAQVKAKIIELRQLVNKFKNNIAMSSSPMDIALFTQANNLFLNVIDLGLKDSLRSWPTPDLSSLESEFARSARLPSPAQIMQKVTNNQAILERITEDSYHVGTNHYQRTYKKLCTRLGLWWDKAAKPQYLIPAATLGYGAYLKLAPQDNWLAKGFKLASVDINDPKVVAGGIAMSAIIPSVKEYTKEYVGNWLLYTIIGLGLGIDKFKKESEMRIDTSLPFDKALQATLLGTYIAIVSRDQSSSIGPWIKHKFTNLHEKLQGVPITKTAAEKLKEETMLLVTFDDIIGNQEIKTKFKLLADYITDPEKFDSAGLTPERGYLLVGGSRAGKSFMAKALYGEVKRLKRADERYCRFAQIHASYINTYGFKFAMDALRADGPCIVFIDEIDLLNLNRDDHGKPNELLSSILTWMGGEVETNPNKQMIIIAATNRPDKIDPALRQHGRFGEIIPFRYPTYDERLEFLVKKLNKNGIMLTMDMIKQLAQETDNRPYDDLEAIMNSALQLAFCEHRPVEQQDFQNALDQNVHHIANNCQALILTEQEIKIVAAHQAGQALATHLIQPTERISMVTTEPINQPVPEQPAQNHSLYQPSVQHGTTLTYPMAPRSQFHNQAQLIQLTQLELAGHLAQTVLLGTCAYAYNKAAQDRALELAMQITLDGLNINSLSKQNLALKKDAAIALIEQLKRDTLQLLATNKAKLEQIYAALLKQKTIREADFYKLIG